MPQDQLLRARGEDILGEPRLELARIAEWLGRRTDADPIEAMLHPERSPYAVIGALPPGLDNDPGFVSNPRLRLAEVPPSSRMPEEWQIEPWLCDQVRGLAAKLGYPD